MNVIFVGTERGVPETDSLDEQPGRVEQRDEDNAHQRYQGQLRISRAVVRGSQLQQQECRDVAERQRPAVAHEHFQPFAEVVVPEKRGDHSDGGRGQQRQHRVVAVHQQYGQRQ